MAVVLADTCGATGLEMVDPAVGKPFEVAHAGHPELGSEVGVAVHAGSVFDAVAADDVPNVAVHEVGWPCGALPVVHGVRHVFAQEPFFVECLEAVAIVGEDADIEAVVGLNHGAREEETVVGQGVDLCGEDGVPSGQHIHVVVEVEYVVGLYLGAHHVAGQADADVVFAVGVVEALVPNPLQGAV